MATLQQRFPSVTTIVADAASIPFDSGQFDIVTSQFGAEYAGEAAFREARRMLAPNGSMGFMIHHAEGSIYQKCASSLDAVRRTRESKFIPLALRLFETGFAALRGADRTPYDAAGTALNPALAVLEDVIHTHGADVAGGTIALLYEDVAKIHGQLPQYNHAEVAAWLQKTEFELEAFSGRMSSMCESALDEAAFARLVSEVSNSGLTIVRADSLKDPQDTRPLAWIIVARRQ
jgi:hypothetical protein